MPGVAAPATNTYDLFGEVTQTVDPAGAVTAFTYYPTGLPNTTTYPNLTTSTQTQDPVGNVRTVSQPTGAGAHTTESRAHYSCVSP